MVKNDIWCSLVLGLMFLSSCLNRVEVAPSTAVESIPGSFAGEEFKLLNPQFLYCMKRGALFIKMDEFWTPMNISSIGNTLLLAPERAIIDSYSNDSLSFTFSTKDSVSFRYIYNWIPSSASYTLQGEMVCTELDANADRYFKSEVELVADRGELVRATMRRRFKDKSWKTLVSGQSLFAETYKYYHSALSRLRLCKTLIIDPQSLVLGSNSPSHIQIDTLLLYSNNATGIIYATSPHLIRNANNSFLSMNGNNCISLQITGAESILNRASLINKDDYGMLYKTPLSDIRLPLLAKNTDKGVVLYTSYSNTFHDTWIDDSDVLFIEEYMLLKRSILE